MDSLGKHAEKPSVSQHGRLTMNRLPVKENGEHLFAVKFSTDGKYIAATFGSGCVRTFDAATFAPMNKAKVSPQHDDLPSTSVKWSPAEREEGEYAFATCSSGGGVYLWSWEPRNPEAKVIDRVARILEEGNDTACIDYSPDGTMLASVGSDRKVRVYDLENKGKLAQTMERGTDEKGGSRPAHTNRIFSVKFASPTTALSAGWEAPVQVWDLRTGKSERQLGGPQVSGDALEVTGTTRVLISSSRQSKQLQVFDFISGREIEAESAKLSSNIGTTSLMGARFSKEANAVFAVGSKPDTIFCIDATGGAINGTIGEIGAPLYAADISPVLPKRCVFAGMKETLLCVDWE